MSQIRRPKVKRKSSIERDEFTEIFLSLVDKDIKNFKTYDEITIKIVGKTTPETSPEYIKKYNSVRQYLHRIIKPKSKFKQFIKKEKSKYSIYYDGIFLYLSELAKHKYSKEWLNLVYGSFGQSFLTYLNKFSEELIKYSLSYILNVFMSSHNLFLTDYLIEESVDLDIFVTDDERQKWIDMHPKFSVSAVNDLTVLSDLSQAFAYEQGVLSANKPLMKLSLDFWQEYYKTYN